MGNVILQKETTIDPISLIGREAGVCWGADITDTEKITKEELTAFAPGMEGHGNIHKYM